MKKILITMMLFLPMWISAAERSVDDAAAVAARFMNEQQAVSPARKATYGTNAYTLVHTRAKKNSTDPAFYVFNRANNQGYVIVSGDDRTEDVLVYSDQGQFDPENINPNFRFWLNRLQEEVSFANDSNAVDKSAPRTATTVIGPLLVTEDGEDIGWYQETPYNNLCPMDNYDNTRCYTGCVATAAAMILRKWRYPAQGIGSKTYTWKNEYKRSQSETLTANFGETTYDWDNMLPGYSGVDYTTEQATAVATLMFHLGVACEMNYGGDRAGGSGSWTDDMGYGLKTYFGYNVDKFISTYSKNNYASAKQSGVADLECEWNLSLSDFTPYFNTELEAGRPIFMGGETSDGSGHEFVCDGRNTNGYFHINWGWEDNSNSYCSISNLKPKGENYNFSSEVDALLGLQPLIIDTVHVTGVSVSPNIDTLDINDKVHLSATIAPADATIQQVSWVSTNPSVASVTATGWVRGLSQGTTLIIAQTQEGAFRDTATIVVTNTVVTSDVFTLVTDIETLGPTDEIILVGTYLKTDYAATLDLTSGKNNAYLGVEVVTINDSTITLNDTSNVAIFTLSDFGNYWKLTTENYGALSVIGSKKLAWNQTYDTWDISISNDVATIASTNDNYGRILLNGNSGNPRYCNYTSTTSTSMLLPYIFARSSTKGGDTPSAIEPTLMLEKTATKCIIHGQLYILHDGVWYDIMGNRRQ